MGVVGMIGESGAHNQTRCLIDRQLRLVLLGKPVVATVFHDAAVGVGKVILIFVPRTRGRRWGSLAGRFLPRARLFLSLLAEF